MAIKWKEFKDRIEKDLGIKDEDVVDFDLDWGFETPKMIWCGCD